jgi:chromate reductase, NAD(P)H dehydrogenase (quinone)
MLKILAISGSLRPNSSNMTILRLLSDFLPDGIEVEIYHGIGDLPYFNPEIDNGTIPSVQDWRDRLKAADAVVFCTPEYAHGVPGVLKNALDWIVSSGEFMHKPTAVISASPSPDGGNHANESLVRTLKVMMANIPTDSILCISGVSAKLKAPGGIDAETEQALRSLLQAIYSQLPEIVKNN